MSLLRDILLAIAMVLSGFAYYEAKLKPIYVCDIQAIVKEYVHYLKNSKVSYEDKEKMLTSFMHELRKTLNTYGTVYKKGAVTGGKVRDITSEVRAKLFGISSYKLSTTNHSLQQ